ncbi:MAG: Ger(x)C family spore germination C-terminal domain-containing protein [Bacillota bacterium]|nr:Ger(x)C family spore germination C-terminal domain-containing protein [Bacillota bacterium]
MLPKKARIIALTASFSVIFAGCWDSLDINNRDICTAVIADQERGAYSFYAEIANVTAKVQQGGQNGGQGGGGDQGPATYIARGHGESFAETRLSIDNNINKQIFLGAVQALIITENMAKKGILQYAYRIRQSLDYRKTMDVLVTSDRPDNFFSVKPENSSTVGFAINYTLRSLERSGKTFHMSLDDLLQKLASKNPSYLLSSVSVKNGQIMLSGYSVFDGDKDIGFIPYEKAKGTIFLMLGGGGKSKFDYPVMDGEESVTFEVSLKSMKIKADYSMGKVSFTLDMKFTARLLYPSNAVRITSEKLDKIREKLKKQLESEISEALFLSRAYYKCDYFSMSEAFRIAHPGAYKKMIWKDEFVKASFSTNIKVDLKKNYSIDYNPGKEWPY